MQQVLGKLGVAVIWFTSKTKQKRKNNINATPIQCILASSPLIRDQSWIITEHSIEEKLLRGLDGEKQLEKFKEKRYWKVVLGYYDTKKAIE